MRHSHIKSLLPFSDLADGLDEEEKDKSTASFVKQDVLPLTLRSVDDSADVNQESTAETTKATRSRATQILKSEKEFKL